MSSDSTSRQRANRALDATNFFLADVRDGLGPYLAVYLLTEQKWDEAHIGMVMSAGNHRGHRRTDAGRCADRCNQSKAPRDGCRRAIRHRCVAVASDIS